MIKVLYFEDDELVGQSVSAVLQSDPRFTWLGWSTDPRKAADQVEQLGPDVLILDLDMPGASGEETLQAISSRSASTRVLIFSGKSDHSVVERAIEHGAWGFVSKADGHPALTQAILNVAQGQFALSPTARKILDGT